MAARVKPGRLRVDLQDVSASDLALVRGIDPTRAALRRWNARPLPVVGAWTAASLAVAVALLLAVWAIARVATPDPVGYVFPGLTREARASDVLAVLQRNALVLALHAFACVAGFIAGSQLPDEAARHTGRWRRVHDRAGPLAIAFVTAATAFSLATQAYALGHAASTLAAQGGMDPGLFLVGLLPHAVPELTALFLPLAAWIVAGRAGRWDELLAATLVTVALAVPVLVLAAVVEVHVSPHVVLWLRG